MEGKYLSSFPLKNRPLIGWLSRLTNQWPSFWQERALEIGIYPLFPFEKKGDHNKSSGLESETILFIWLLWFSSLHINKMFLFLPFKAIYLVLKSDTQHLNFRRMFLLFSYTQYSQNLLQTCGKLQILVRHLVVKVEMR